MKTCKKCNEIKELTEFYKTKNKCKNCDSIEQKIWRKNNIEKVKKITKQSYIKHKEKRNQYRKDYYRKNKKRELENSKKWQKLNIEKRRSVSFKFNYNLTLDERKEMFEKQNGCCKICNKHESLFKRILEIDHCHKTGKVRGLLCHLCNMLLGCAKDNSEILITAANYIKDIND